MNCKVCGTGDDVGRDGLCWDCFFKIDQWSGERGLPYYRVEDNLTGWLVTIDAYLEAHPPQREE